MRSYAILWLTFACLAASATNGYGQDSGKANPKQILLDQLRIHQSDVMQELRSLSKELDEARLSAKDSTSLLTEDERSKIMAELVNKALTLEAEVSAADAMKNIRKEKARDSIQKTRKKIESEILKLEINKQMIKKQLELLSVWQKKRGGDDKASASLTRNSAPVHAVPPTTDHHGSTNESPDDLFDHKRLLTIHKEMINKEQLQSQLSTLEVERASLQSQIENIENGLSTEDQLEKMTKETQLQALHDQLKRLKKASSDGMRIRFLRKEILRKESLLDAISMKIFDLEIKIFEEATN